MSAVGRDDLLAQLLAPSVNRGGKGSAREDSRMATDPLKDDPLTSILAAENPILEAAGPLLRTLADLPSLSASNVEQLRELLVQDVKTFQKLCERAGFRRDHALTMRYCLCTALDEAVNQMPWAHDSDWMSNCLLIAFHNESSGGEKFFHLLGRMSQSPREYLHVLEAMYHILSLGFQGRYALVADGPHQLELIQNRLLEILLEYRPPGPTGLSPHWEGHEGKRLQILWTLPVWVTACVAGALILGLYLALQTGLTPKAQRLTNSVASLEKTAIPSVFSPRNSLAEESFEQPLELWFKDDQKKQFNLKIDLDESKIILPGDIFVSGITLNRDIGLVLDILADRLDESQRKVAIIGHTDNVPIRPGSVFRNNKHLSEERARVVAEALIDRGIASERLTYSGEGDSMPVVPNTIKGNARNRRVEMFFLSQP